MNLPTQSPHWDDVLPLADMLAQAKFFVLKKGDPHGDLVAVVMSEDGPTRYIARWLGHDACGVTCEADGSFGRAGLATDLAAGRAELTTDKEAVLQYIGNVMECRPVAEFSA